MKPPIAPLVIFLPGHLGRTAGGGKNYAIAHGRAAECLGYDVHFFYYGEANTGVGTHHPLQSKRMVRHFDLPRLTGELEKAVVDYVMSLPPEKSPPAVLIHSFGVWCFTADRIAVALRQRGIPAVALAGSYTSFVREKWSQLTGSLGYSPANSLFLLTLWARGLLFIHHREAKGYRNAKVVLVNYNKVQSDLEKSFGRPLRYRKIAYCAESAFLTNLPNPAPECLLPPGSQPLIVVISRHDSRKGIDVMLKALHELKTTGHPFRAILVGSGPLWRENRRLAARLDLNEVVFAGFVKDALSYLRAADIFVLPSRAEQSGSVSLLEAFQCGIATVASACDGIPEDITHGKNGLLAEPGNPQDLAKKIVMLLKDAGLREKLGVAGRVTYEQRFSREALVRDLGAVYAGLLRELDVTPNPHNLLISLKQRLT
jgi:glycosyltransferase involved in cell wall biosynthesis